MQINAAGGSLSIRKQTSMKKNVRNFILFLCTVLNISVLYNPPVYAEEAVILEAGAVEGKTGDTVTIPVSIYNSSAVAALDITVVYDPAELSYISAEKGAAAEEGTLCDINHLSDQSSIRFVFASLDEIPEDGDIMQISFQILKNEPQQHTVDLDVSGVFNMDSQRLTWKTEGGREIAPTESDGTDAKERRKSAESSSESNDNEDLSDGSLPDTENETGSDRRFFAKTKDGIKDVTDTAASRTGENLLEEGSALGGAANKESEISDTGSAVTAAVCAVIILVMITVGVIIYRLKKNK